MRKASKALSTIGEPAVPFLIGAISDHNDNVRWQAVAALGHMDRKHAMAAIPALMAASHDTDPDVRAAAVEALILIKASKTQLVTELVKVQNDVNAMVRVHAYWALWKLGENQPDQLKKLIALLGHEDWMAVDAAIRFLTQTGKAGLAALGEAAFGKDAKVAKGAAITLGKMGSSGHPALGSLLGSAHKTHRMLALTGLYEMGPEAEPFADEIARFLYWEENDLVLKAIKTLGAIGPKAGASLPKLIPLLKNENPDIRAATAKTVGQIGTQTAALKALLNDPVDHVRAAAAEALKK